MDYEISRVNFEIKKRDFGRADGRGAKGCERKNLVRDNIHLKGSHWRPEHHISYRLASNRSISDILQIHYQLMSMELRPKFQILG